MSQASSPDRFRPIPHDSVRVGERPLYDICTRQGELIWRRGKEITQEAYQQLVSREFYFDTLSAAKGNERVERERNYERRDTSLATALQPLPPRLDNLLGDLLNGGVTDPRNRVYAYVDQLHELGQRDRAALFGLLHLDTHHPDYLTHPMQSAVLCDLLADALGLSGERRRCLMAAALTQDLGSLQVMKKLERAPSTVSKEQLAGLREHPGEGAKLLAQCGIRQRDWLKAVMCHHEAMAGDGGSYGLHGDAIPLYARIIAAADAYILLNKPGGKGGAKEMERLVEAWSRRQFPLPVDPELMERIADHLGAIPPGALVVLDLKKGQDPNYTKNPVAVVIRPNEQLTPGAITGGRDAKFFPNACIINDNGKASIALKGADLYLQQRRLVRLLHPRLFGDYNKELEPHQFWD